MKNIIFTIFLAIPILARTECDLKSPIDTLNRIIENHPNLKINNLLEKSYKSEMEIAKQTPNPELEFESSMNDEFNGDNFSTSFSLKYSFELGGKKAARVERAKSFIGTKSYQKKKDKEDLIIETVLKLNDLRQNLELIPIFEESIDSFRKILQRLKKIKSLSPTQEVERETLELAIYDYKLKLSNLNSIKVNLNKHLSFFMNMDCEIPLKALPFNPNFPKEVEFLGINKFSDLKILEKELENAKAELSYQKSLSISNLDIGPVIEYGKEKGEQITSFGVSLTMDLPIFNSNNGGKAKALSNINLYKKKLKFAKEEADLDFHSLKSKYLGLINSLDGVVNRDKLNKKHDKIEKYYKRGIIPISMVIESHRQLLEFTKSRFEIEREALEALWTLYKINGDIERKEI